MTLVVTVAVTKNQNSLPFCFIVPNVKEASIIIGRVRSTLRYKGFKLLSLGVFISNITDNLKNLTLKHCIEFPNFSKQELIMYYNGR